MQVSHKNISRNEIEQPEKRMLSPKTYEYPLLRNVHLWAPAPMAGGTKLARSSTFLTRGDFTYFHYECDGFPDSGWGCAYRTLQSACSWILAKKSIENRQFSDVEMANNHSYSNFPVDITRCVPSLPEIQETLVRIGDKPNAFSGTGEWIGALEVFFVLDAFYDIPCKILHVPQRDDLKRYANVLKRYFEDFGGFVMMGGNVDTAAKGIAGIHIGGNQAYFLVVDPHFVGQPKSAQELIDRGYIRWQHTSEFVDSSFYNLCLPQYK